MAGRRLHGPRSAVVTPLRKDRHAALSKKWRFRKRYALKAAKICFKSEPAGIPEAGGLEGPEVNKDDFIRFR
jgi:hypothetical protein